MSKGSRQRPIKNKKQFEENWDKIFGRKKTPKHAMTQRHADKTKYDRKKQRHVNMLGEDMEYWDSDFEEQSREL